MWYDAHMGAFVMGRRVVAVVVASTLLLALLSATSVSHAWRLSSLFFARAGTVTHSLTTTIVARYDLQ